MSGLAPETLVQSWLPEHIASAEAAIFSEPFHVPYGQLARIDGWVLWLGHPPVPDGLPILPAPEEMLWGEPSHAIATALLVAADYAIRRGARDAAAARVVLHRETPVAIVIPGPLNRSLEPMLQAAEGAGLPVIRGEIESTEELAALIEPFGARRMAHSVNVGRLHDPALSFQSYIPEYTIGANSLSSFVVHNEPERDEVTVTGELGQRVAIEIGVSGPDIDLATTAKIETLAAEIPSFLDRVSASVLDHRVTIGWREGDAPMPEQLGRAIQAWLKALAGAQVVDVRIAFAPEKGRSALLTEMRTRAAAFHEFREASIAGAADPLAVVSDRMRQQAD